MGNENEVKWRKRHQLKRRKTAKHRKSGNENNEMAQYQ
jgi:hypothetical protein